MATAVGTMVVIQVLVDQVICVRLSKDSVPLFMYLNSLWNIALRNRVALVQLVCQQKTFTFLISLNNGHDGTGLISALCAFVFMFLIIFI